MTDTTANPHCTHDPNALAHGLQEVASVLGDSMFALQEAGGFSCSEADKVAAALAMVDLEAAARFLSGHALGDQPTDDDHHHGLAEEDDAAAYIRDRL